MTIRKLRRSLNSSKRPVRKRKPESGFSKRLIRGLEVGAAVVTILGFILGLFVCRDRDHVGKGVVSHGQKGGITARSHNDNSVTSYGQSGGITAQSVTAKTIIVNSYFDKQPSDEKETLQQSLKAKYPLGYAIFAADGTRLYIPPDGLTFERDFEIEWASAKVVKLTSDMIWFDLPDIVYKPTGNELTNCGFGFPRKVGHAASPPLVNWKESVPIIEVLDDQGSFVVLVLGFAEKR